jgi:hypothetical protein
MLVNSLGYLAAEFLARPCPPIACGDAMVREPTAADWPVVTELGEILTHINRRRDRARPLGTAPDSTTTRQHMSVVMNKLAKKHMVDRVGNGRFRLSKHGVDYFAERAAMQQAEQAEHARVSAEVCFVFLRMQLDELYERNKHDQLPIDFYRMPHPIVSPWYRVKRELGMKFGELHLPVGFANVQDWLNGFIDHGNLSLEEKGDAIAYSLLYLRRREARNHHAAEVASFYPTATNTHDVRTDIATALKIPAFDALYGHALREEVAGDPNFVTESLNHPVH